jgi:hypothetical protein
MGKKTACQAMTVMKQGANELSVCAKIWQNIWQDGVSGGGAVTVNLADELKDDSGGKAREAKRSTAVATQASYSVAEETSAQ